MIPELGHFAIILALNCALIVALLPTIGIRFTIKGWMSLVKPLTHLHLFLIAVGFICLSYSFIQHDFSVAYVARNSNSHLPLLYCISGVWGAHEGSLLLWVFCLAIWMSLVAYFNRQLDKLMMVHILSVMAKLSLGFLAFLLLTSNPFLRLFPYPLEGHDLNPLLQDPGLAIHPPLLYMGYVGLSVPFAFAVAALVLGQLDVVSLQWLRPWTLCAWLFLTLGITLGSFWAYYELGWGGWWFWDPVENASFMPWLLGTALLHSLVVSEKTRMFKSWTLLLAIFSFSLSLLGTFLVRSGILTSVHAFASDPARGIFILVFLSLVIGSALLLFSRRAHMFASATQLSFFSRETFLLSNNVFLVVTAACILLGTLYPLAFDAMGFGKLSVGAPYFNTVFFPLTAPMLVLLGIAVLMRWHSDHFFRLKKRIIVFFVLSAALALFIIFMQTAFKWTAFMGCLLAVWVMLSSINSLLAASFSRRLLGMNIAHLGLAVFSIGVAMSSNYSLARDVKLRPGESLELAGYTLYFNEIVLEKTANYTAKQANIILSKTAEQLTELHPQKRIYTNHTMPMTEVAIYAGVFKDILVAMGDSLDAVDTWSFRIYYKAFIRWIWAGGALMALGGLIAATDGGRRFSKFVAPHAEV